MKSLNLQLKDKLQLGVAGQLLLVVALVLFFVMLNSRIHKMTGETRANQKESKLINEYIFKALVFSSGHSTYDELEKLHEQIVSTNNSYAQDELLQQSWQLIEEVYQLGQKNAAIEENVFQLTDSSLLQSNTFINKTAQMLANPETETQVSTLHRLVIAGANANNNNVFTVKVLFLKLKEDLSIKNEVLTHLDNAIEQAGEDAIKLKNTPFAQLPVIAGQMNERFVELTKEFIGNRELAEKKLSELEAIEFELNNQIIQRSGDIIQHAMVRLRQSVVAVFVVLLIISVIVIAVVLQLKKVMTYIFNDITKLLQRMSNGELNQDIEKG